MSPYLRIQQRYLETPREHSFGWYCDWHFRNGYVFSTPDYFLMMRAVVGYWPDEVMLDLNRRPDFDVCDTWYVHAFAGDMSKALAMADRELPILPWVAFERVIHGALRLTFVQRSSLKRLISISSKNHLLLQ